MVHAIVVLAYRFGTYLVRFIKKDEDVFRAGRTLHQQAITGTIMAAICLV